MINAKCLYPNTKIFHRVETSLKKMWCVAVITGALAQSASALDTLTTWLYNTSITLNGSSSGANISTTQYNFPVLIRLTSSNAAAVFAEAQSNGGDLRFSHAADTGQIPYELNYYNPATQQAFIWVKADSVTPSATPQTIRMWWGKSAATTVRLQKVLDRSLFKLRDSSGVCNILLVV
jgi:hypothetical protein